MPISNQKVVKIILDECALIEERCPGYKEELVDTLVEIIEAEEQHRVQGTHIQKKIDDKCNAAGDFLAKNQGITESMEENF